jgi:hypothetical protein
MRLKDEEFETIVAYERAQAEARMKRIQSETFRFK